MRRLATLLVTAASLAALAPPALAGRSVPQGFVGTNVDGFLAGDSTARFSSQLKPMAQAGVESIRMTFAWARIQPYAKIEDVPEAIRARYRIVDGVPTDFTLTDAWVAGAARRGLRLMPMIMFPPGWASRHPGSAASPPKDNAQYARFVVALVRRYGSAGSFWSERPDVPKLAIVRWQLWNEPQFRSWWSDRPWADDYVRLLKRSYPAIHSADHAAKVVLAGLTNESWDRLWEIYGAGGKGYFDYVALHPFTEKPKGLLTIIGLAREVMTYNNDGKRRVLLTEMSWTSAKGKTPQKYTFDMTPAGQATRLAAAYKLLAEKRKELKIDTVYWYTWTTTDSSHSDSFGYSGVTKLRNGKIVRKPAYDSLRQTALALEGR